MTRLARKPTRSESAATAESAEELGSIGTYTIEVERSERGGSLCLRPQNGQALLIEVQGDRLTVRYEGPELRLEAPNAEMKLAARNIELNADERVTVHGGQEVDLHSGVDVEVRADHHVNLWGHGVRVGD